MTDIDLQIEEIEFIEQLDDFDNGDSINGKAVCHFTQLVWKDSKEVGFGISIQGRKCIVVGNYYPAGNKSGEEPRNVLPEK